MADTPDPSLISSLQTLLHTRHTTRIYKSTPVPPSLIHKSLALAQQSASNTNTQPWVLYLASGPRASRIKSAVHTAACNGAAPNIPPLPAHFNKYRSELGHKIYGAEGYDIARDDRAKHRELTLRNFSFFDAPTIGVVCIDRTLDSTDHVSVGIWLQAFVLALTGYGIGSSLIVSVTGYPDVLRKEFGIPEEMITLCGVSIGYADETHRINSLDAGRNHYSQHVVWEEEELKGEVSKVVV